MEHWVRGRLMHRAEFIRSQSFPFIIPTLIAFAAQLLVRHYASVNWLLLGYGSFFADLVPG
jgi:hypothetical protein